MGNASRSLSRTDQEIDQAARTTRRSPNSHPRGNLLGTSRTNGSTCSNSHHGTPRYILGRASFHLAHLWVCACMIRTSRDWSPYQNSVAAQEPHLNPRHYKEGESLLFGRSTSIFDHGYRKKPSSRHQRETGRRCRQTNTETPTPCILSTCGHPKHPSERRATSCGPSLHPQWDPKSTPWCLCRSSFFLTHICPGQLISQIVPS